MYCNLVAEVKYSLKPTCTLLNYLEMTKINNIQNIVPCSLLSILSLPKTCMCHIDHNVISYIIIRIHANCNTH